MKGTNAMSTLKPHEKMPEQHSTDKQPSTKEEKIDAQMADSFPPAIRPPIRAAITSSARRRAGKAILPLGTSRRDRGRKRK